MIFNSNPFLVFFAVVSLLYWLVRSNARWRDGLILGASLVFYGSWDWRFLALLLLTGGLDHLCALKIESEADPSMRRRWLGLSVVSNLGALFFFKYSLFFVHSAVALLERLGLHASRPTLQVILPAGISFYTFQALSYTVDVHRRKVAAERSLLRFLAFLTFFPQLVAGPIERASFLLSQFRVPRSITGQALGRGVWFLLWGFFLKVVVADQLAPLSDLVFGPGNPGGWVVLWGVLAFAGQIYGDFAGYSLIARGLACTMGFELSENFSQPYLSTDIQEFWRRWHQTLSQWFRDYVYIPLGGDRLGGGRTVSNILLTFLLAGLWHGANWTFLVWGLCHGLALAGYRLWSGTAMSRRIRFPRPVGWAMTMTVVVVGWLFFRSDSLSHALGLISAGLRGPDPAWGSTHLRAVMVGWAMIAGSDWFLRTVDWERASRWPAWSRVGLQGALLACIVARWGRETPNFIYFQF